MPFKYHHFFRILVVLVPVVFIVSCNSPRYQVLPLDELIPATTSFDYLDTELISQFAIFLKDSDESNCGSHQQFEIAAVGKLRNPDAFDVR